MPKHDGCYSRSLTDFEKPNGNTHSRCRDSGKTDFREARIACQIANPKWQKLMTYAEAVGISAKPRKKQCEKKKKQAETRLKKIPRCLLSKRCRVVEWKIEQSKALGNDFFKSLKVAMSNQTSTLRENTKFKLFGMIQRGASLRNSTILG